MAEEPAFQRLAGRVLLVDEQNRILLLKWAPDWGGEIWITPGGGVEPGETVAEAALRELWEETGLKDVTLGPQICFKSGSSRAARQRTGSPSSS